MKSFIRPARTFALSATSFTFSAIATVFVLSLLAGYFGTAVSSAPGSGAFARKGPAKKTMTAFGSDEELRNYFRQLVEEQKRAQARARKEASGNPPPAPAANQAASSIAKSADGYAAKDDESITNTQHAGVDEGGIVKLHGDHLVVLRRGRLFTVAVGDGALQPISSVDAFGPEINPRSTW